MVKSAPFGLPYSFADIRSTHLDEGIAVMMHTPSYRVAGEQWPVYLANRYYYQLGPFSSEALSVLINAYDGNIFRLNRRTLFTKIVGVPVELQHVRSMAKHFRQTLRHDVPQRRCS